MRKLLENYIFPSIVFAGLVLALIFYYPVHAQVIDSTILIDKTVVANDLGLVLVDISKDGLVSHYDDNKNGRSCYTFGTSISCL